MVGQKGKPLPHPRAHKVRLARQPELDVAKVAAIFCMVIIHVAENMGTIMDGRGMAPVLLDFIGGPLAAPVFMFAMGVGMVFTRHDTPGDFARRGLRLLVTGYVLNFFRETILIIAAHLLSFETAYDKTLLATIGTVDIFHFAGMSFLLVALLKWVGARPHQVLAASVILQAFGSLTSERLAGLSEPAQYLLGLLFFTNDYIAFPALLWFVYPAAGMCFGALLQGTGDKDVFYKRAFLAGLVSFVSVTVATLKTGASPLGYFMDTKYYQQNLFGSLWTISVVLMLLGVCHVVAVRTAPRATEWIQTTSSQVNIIYVIQWLLISYAIAARELMGSGRVPDAWVVSAGMLFAIASIALARIYANAERRRS